MSDVMTAAIPSHPADVACIDLVNSAATDYLSGDLAFDRLHLAEWRSWFTARYGLRVGSHHPVPVAALARMRTRLRRMLVAWAQTGALSLRDLAYLDRWVSTPSLRQRVRVQSDGRPAAVIEPARRDWDWVMSRIAASAVELVTATPPERLKTCANPACSWMFRDPTLNASKRFCSTDLCGNLHRVRRFRERRAQADSVT